MRRVAARSAACARGCRNAIGVSPVPKSSSGSAAAGRSHTERDHLAKMTVIMTGNDTPKTVTFNVEGGGTIKYDNNYPRVDGVATATVDSSENPIVIDFWTYNQGNTVYAEYRGRFEA